MDVHRRCGVVAELYIRGWPPERCLAHIRIAREVETVWLVEDVLVATEEYGVPQGGSELACATTDVHGTVAADDLPADDRTSTHVPLASVRCPALALRENVWPRITIAPLVARAMSWILVTLL